MLEFGTVDGCEVVFMFACLPAFESSSGRAVSNRQSFVYTLSNSFKDVFCRVFSSTCLTITAQ